LLVLLAAFRTAVALYACINLFPKPVASGRMDLTLAEQGPVAVQFPMPVVLNHDELLPVPVWQAKMELFLVPVEQAKTNLLSVPLEQAKTEQHSSPVWQALAPMAVEPARIDSFPAHAEPAEVDLVATHMYLSPVFAENQTLMKSFHNNAATYSNTKSVLAA